MPISLETIYIFDSLEQLYISIRGDFNKCLLFIGYVAFKALII